MINFTSNQNAKTDFYKKYERSRNFNTGAICAGAAYAYRNILQRIIVPRTVQAPLINFIRTPLDETSLENTKKVANDIVNETLSKEGVRLINHNIPGEYYGQDQLPRFLRNLPIPDVITEFFTRNDRSALDTVARGQNGAFDSNLNAILVNQDSPMLCSVFHEIGHAHNYHKSPFWRGIFKYGCRASRMIPPALIAYTLFTKKETPEEGEKLTKKQKVKNFIRKYSPVLVFASILPKFLEEARATGIGNRLAREKLDAVVANRIRTLDNISLNSYRNNMLIWTATALCAKLSKDMLDKYTQIKHKHATATNNKQPIKQNTNPIFKNFTK